MGKRVKIHIHISRLLPFFLLFVVGCRKAERITPPVVTPTTPGQQTQIKGFYLLNQGNMGSNKASIDYFDYESGDYHKNIYPSRNPEVVKELGDVGNDIKIYGEKLYVVINASNLVEVMDVRTARHITSIAVPNCRYIGFFEGHAYVSSFAGPVQLDPNARLGYVAKIDTATLTVTDTCVVGYQPEDLTIRDRKLYVANSGGYRLPYYDNTVSVIDLDRFTEIKKITAGINLHRLQQDNYGNIYVSSRGNYQDIPSNVYIIGANDLVTDVLNVPVSNMVINGDSLFFYSAEWSNQANANTIAYGVIDTRTKKATSQYFIKNGIEQQIVMPYGIAVNPETREVFIMDARDHITPGRLYCFASDGTHKWTVETGDIPAGISFASNKLTDLSN